MLQLQIDRIEASYLSANILDMAVSEFPDPTVSAAQQVLVQIEYCHLEKIAQLSPPRKR